MMASRWTARVPAFLAIGIVLTAAGAAAAGERWRVVILHPQGAKASDGLAAAGGWQGGSIEIQLDGGPFRDHPVIWNGRADEYTDLLPTDWLRGCVYGMDGPWQVGEVKVFGDPAAMLWRGTAESAINLTPYGSYRFAGAKDVTGNQQVGYAACRCDNQYHAMLWRGTPESYVDLHPASARYSSANSTDGEFQGGDANIVSFGQIHAVLWRGSAESYLDMHPEVASSSSILGMVRGVQVGVGLFGSYDHALLWRGTPESLVDLHPSYARESWVYDTTGSIHVGYIDAGAAAEAGFWIGDDSESFFNLQDLLPSGWSRSSAKSVAIDAGRVYISGTALAPDGHGQALLWIGRLPRDPRRGGSVKPLIP
ncbi:MAG: hypothetical protein IT449_00870 [Phycisphaerales bacterium]|nr:hypothetical protein [Phycisphaerales bacterium]